MNRVRCVSWSCAESRTTVQLIRGIPGRLGHHWRTKWALSGHHGGNGNGLGLDWGWGPLRVLAEVETVGVVSGVTASPTLLLASASGGVSEISVLGCTIGGKTNFLLIVFAGETV